MKGFKLEQLFEEATLSDMIRSRKEKKEQSYWVCASDGKSGGDKIPMTENCPKCKKGLQKYLESGFALEKLMFSEPK